MENREAVDILQANIVYACEKAKISESALWSINDALNHVISALEQQEADGCQGCAFTDVEEWEMPCAKCRRACKDYWRPAKDERM